MTCEEFRKYNSYPIAYLLEMTAGFRSALYQHFCTCEDCFTYSMVRNKPERVTRSVGQRLDEMLAKDLADPEFYKADWE